MIPVETRGTPLTDEEMAKVEKFIREKGVTKCPASLTPEMVALHKRRDEEWAALTAQERMDVGRSRWRAARRPLLPQTPERARRNAHQRRYLRKKKLERLAEET